MNPEENYISVNRNSWNNRVGAHLSSDFYDMPGFLAGKSSLQEIELNLLGDLSGKSVLHLQCHFGQDSISLSRLGASVTGVDLSNVAVETARKLANQTQADAEFICCDVYSLPNHLNKKFDVVFTSYGVIGWLPDLDQWAKIITHFLKEGGQFVMAEFHPVLWMFDDDFKYIKYNYFNAGAIAEVEQGTYADKNADLSQQYITWNHSLSEVLSSLLENGLQITAFREFNYSPYNCFNHTVEYAPGKYRLTPFDDKIPMVYALRAVKGIKEVK